MLFLIQLLLFFTVRGVDFLSSCADVFQLLLNSCLLLFEIVKFRLRPVHLLLKFYVALIFFLKFSIVLIDTFFNLAKSEY